MKLSELLEDAPPARYDADDAVRAGRRLRFRRRSTAVIAAVVAVAAAIGVPQLTTHSASQKPAPVAPATPIPEYTFRGYDTGKFHVTRPYQWDLAAETAQIWRSGDPVGWLSVFHSGVQPGGGVSSKRTPTADIGGRPAYFVEESGTSWLIFQSADGAYAQVMSLLTAFTRDEQRQVAEAFRPTAPYPATVAMGLQYVPPGYLLVGISGPEEKRLNSAAEFAPAADAMAALSTPSRHLPSGRGGMSAGYRIMLEPVQGDEGAHVVVSGGPSRGDAYCRSQTGSSGRGSEAFCSVDIAQTRGWKMNATGPNDSQAAVHRLLDATTTVPDLLNPTGWLTVDRAFPASALAAIR